MMVFFASGCDGAATRTILSSPRRGRDVPRRLGITDDPQIDAIVLDQFVHSPRVLILQPDVRLGVPGHELLHEAVHVAEAHRVDRRDGYPACHVFVQRADFFHQRVISLDDLPAAVVVDLALGREHKGRLVRSISLTPRCSSSW